MKHCRVIAGFTGIVSAFISLYILFVGPSGVNLWYQAFLTQLLASGGTVLLMSEKTKATYFAAGAYLISLVIIVMQIISIQRYAVLSFDHISNYILLLFYGISLVAFVFAFVSIFDREYGQTNIFKRTK